jgi:hypothetical protein
LTSEVFWRVLGDLEVVDQFRMDRDSPAIFKQVIEGSILRTAFSISLISINMH